jgi:hypothetical protein
MTYSIARPGPPLHADYRKTASVTVVMTPREYHALYAGAKAARISLSAYLRRVVEAPRAQLLGNRDDTRSHQEQRTVTVRRPGPTLRTFRSSECQCGQTGGR